MRMPAMVAIMKVARVPPIIARMHRRAMSSRREGTRPPTPPIWMATEPIRAARVRL